MNMNSFNAVQNLPGPLSTVETAFAAIAPIGGSSTGYGGQQTLQSGTTRAIVGVPADIVGAELDGQPFVVAVAASWVATGAANVTVNVYWNCGANTNTTTFTNDVLVIGSGAMAAASASGSFFTKAILLWDSGSKQLVGFWQAGSGMANIPTPAVLKAAEGATATSPIGISTTASQASLATIAGLQFFATITSSSTANVTSTKLLSLSLERY